MTHFRFLAALLLVFGMAACSTPIEVEPGSLDSTEINDPCLADPTCRVSTRPGLTEADRNRPVVIAVHGFTATTFEWKEFREYAESHSNVLVSQVLLGGHGRDIDDFEESTWEDWGRPIVDEYNALVEQGYKHIILAGSSTGGTLIMEQIHDGAFKTQPPSDFFFIDPIIVPGDKLLSLAPVIGPILGNVPQDVEAGERGYWYENRPAETLAQLNALTKRVRKQLADGFNLPQGSCAYLYKSTGDETVDPVSALLIYKGLRYEDGSHIYTKMVDSDLHVFTRLLGRDPASVSDRDHRNQDDAFSKMLEYSEQELCFNPFD